MNSTVAAQQREQRFRALHEAVQGDLLRFARRRVPASRAEDVVSEVMLVAWRRLDDVPSDTSAARAWLFGVARNILMSSGRRERKQEALPVLLAASIPGHASNDERADVIAVRVDIAAAWTHLSSIHQEALALAVFDELSAPEAASVLDISPTAFRLRLSRARRSLRMLMESAHIDARRPGDVPSVRNP